MQVSEIALSSAAREAAVRLLLRRVGMEGFRDPPQPLAGSVSALRSGLKALERESPKDHKIVEGYMCLDLRSRVEVKYGRELDRAVKWLAQRMPTVILVPEAGPWGEFDDDRADAVNEYGESVMQELFEAWDRDGADEDGEYEPPADDPNAMPAPAPLTVIKPSRSSGGGHRHAPTPKSTDALVLSWAFGQSGDDDDPECAQSFLVEGRDRSDGGRGRRTLGSSSIEKAEAELLGLCPGYTIDQCGDLLRGFGRPTAARREARKPVDAAVFQLLRDHRVTSEALAGALKITLRGVYRSHVRGRELAQPEAA